MSCIVITLPRTPSSRYPCPCCGYQTLPQPPPGTWEICPVCGWEDTPESWRFSSNQVTLREAQLNFQKLGACEPEWIKDVRLPTAEEQRLPHWQTIHQQEAALLEQLAQLGANSKALLSLVFQHVDQSMLCEIAAADWGMDQDAHLQALTVIKAGHIPAPMEWEPKEVLELTRWSQPDHPCNKPQATVDREHWMRLFACAVLIRAAAEPENAEHFLSEESTIIQLIESAIALGTETALAALKFLGWRLQWHYRSDDACSRNDGEPICPYFAVGMLLLLGSLKQDEPEISRYLMTAAHTGEVAPSELFGHCLKAQTWSDLTQRILLDSESVVIPSNEALTQLGRTLLGDIKR